jgi:hypothetical protein
MARVSAIIDAVSFLSRSWWGRIVLAAASILVVWIFVEAAVLSGRNIYDDYLSYGEPLRFEAHEVGERFRVVITSSNRKAKRTLRYRVTDPEGAAIVDDNDALAHASRSFYFTTYTPGSHALVIEDYYRPGGEQAGAASDYLNSKWVRLYRGDSTRLMGLLGHLTLW